MDEYGLGTVEAVRKAQGGAVNENWIVRTQSATVVVRRVARAQSSGGIQFEHCFIRALARRKFPYRLPEPLLTRSGRTVVRRNGMNIWIYDYIAAAGPRPSNAEVVAQLALAMAQAHKAGRRILLRHARTPPNALEDLWLVRALRHWQLKLQTSSDERCRFFRAHAQECIGMLEQLRCTHYPALTRIPIHGDMCRANLVFADGRLKGIIDFGHCSLGPAVRDVAIALRYECSDRKSRFKLDLEAARHFLRVYNDVSRLSPQEVDLIPMIAMAESAELFWWRMFEVASNRPVTVTLGRMQEPFRALRWYSHHRADLARELRAAIS